MLKNIFKKIGIILIELALIGGALWFIAQKRGIENFSQIIPALDQKSEKQEKETDLFPELYQPVKKDFSWKYKNIKYELSLNMDQGAYEYYKKQQKTYSYSAELPQNWEEEYYGMFLNVNSKDKTIENLSQEIKILGEKHNLNDDQIVDLILAFVQSIEYDDAKAKNILDQTGKETMLRPYEILYEQKGVCSDKSLLAVALLRQLGYGAAIFTYPQENHMAIGVECPKDYSTYGSGYCYAETTAVGNRIGIIPSIDPSSNKTVVAKELSMLNTEQIQQINLRQLGQVMIFQKTSGKQYLGIVETKKISDEIDLLKQRIDAMFLQLKNQQKKIDEDKKQLEKLKDDLDDHRKDQNVEKYNSLVEKYNDMLETYKKDVTKYNNDAALYNKSIARYNILIKQ